MDIRAELPRHPLPATPPASRLEITGRVARPRELALAELAELPQHELAEDFTCIEGWTVPGLVWRGRRLADVLDLAEPTADARFVRIGSGEYVVPLPLDQAAGALLCDTLNGEPLTPQHGAPWRLVVAGGSCFTSVKWVDRLELTVEPGRSDGERIARARRQPAADLAPSRPAESA